MLTLTRSLALAAAVVGAGTYWGYAGPAQSRVADKPATLSARAVDKPSATFLSGVVEGFYGNRWSVSDTDAVMGFIAQQGMNTFVYAPKNDPYQRVDWNQLYPAAAFTYLRDVTAAATQDHINFVYSISPGLSIVYSSPADRAALVAKVNQLRTLGVNTFMLSFDDITPALDPTDARVYDNSLSRAQSSLADYLYQRELKVDPAFRLIFTPTDYYGLVDGPYWEGLKTYLDAGIDVAWTGQYVLTSYVDGQQAHLLSEYTGHPIVFWDNYPVNDYTYVQPPHHPRLMMGPLTGRSANLPANLAGYLLNPMLQARASELALYTAAQYLKDPAGYHPWADWLHGVKLLGGPAYASFLVFCQDSRDSFLQGADSGNPTLIADLRQFNANPRRPSAALLDSLANQFRQMAAVNAVLKDKLPDHALYTEIAPWAEQLSLQGHLGLAAIGVLEAEAAGHAGGTDLAAVMALNAKMVASSLVLDTTSEMDAFAAKVMNPS